MRAAFDLFLDIFTYRDNALTRMNPRVKVVAAFLAILCVISSRKIYFPLSMLTCCLAGMIAIRMPLRLVLIRLAPPLGIALVLFALQSLLIGSTPVFTFSVLQWQIVVMEEGARNGMLLGCRVLAAVSVLLLMSSVTPAHQVFLTLRWLGVPKGWVEVAILMYRYTFTILDRAADAMIAQRVRLGYSGVRRSMSSLGVLAGAMILHSFDQAERTHEAMKMRGYKGSMPFGPLPPTAPGDKWIMALTVVSLSITYYFLEWGLL